MQGQDLPIVQLGEPLEQWLARSVPILTQAMGLDPMTAQNLAAQAWDIVNGSGGGNSPAMNVGLQGQAPGGGMPGGPLGGGMGDGPMPGGFGAAMGGVFGKAAGRKAPPWLRQQDDEEEDEEAQDGEETTAEQAAQPGAQPAAPQPGQMPPRMQPPAALQMGAAQGKPLMQPQMQLQMQPGMAQPAMHSPFAGQHPTANSQPPSMPGQMAGMGQMNPQAQAAAQARAQTQKPGGLAQLGTEQPGAAEDEDDGVDWDSEFGIQRDEDASWEDEDSWGDRLLDGAGQLREQPDESRENGAPGPNIPHWYSKEISAFADSLARALADQGLVDQTAGAHLAAAAKEMLANFVNAFLALKPVLTASLAPTPGPLGQGAGHRPQHPMHAGMPTGMGGPYTGKAVKAPTILTFLEGAIHRSFTETADLLRQNGNLTRDERIALSNVVGDMLQTFVQAAQTKLAPETLNRSPWTDVEQVAAAPSGTNTPAWTPGQTVPPGAPRLTTPTTPLSGGFTPMPQVRRMEPVRFGQTPPQPLSFRDAGSNQFAYATRLPNGSPFQRAVDMSAVDSRMPQIAKGKEAVFPGTGAIGAAMTAAHGAERRCAGGKKGGRKGGKGGKRSRPDAAAAGFAYARLDAAAPTKAIAVPLFPETAQTYDLHSLNAAQIEDYIRRQTPRLATKGVSLGGWLDTERGEVTLEVAALVKTPEKAQRLAAQRNVKAFHVLHTGETAAVALPVAAAGGQEAAMETTDSTPEALALHDAWMATKGVPGPVIKSYVRELSPIADQVAVKALGRNRVGGYLVMWGSPTHKDLAGEYFTPQTEEMLSVFKSIGCVPLIYHHAMDDTFKSRVVGVVDVMQPDDVGVWIEAQIKAASEYQKFIKPLVDSKLLGLSSGTLPGARRVNKATGEIQRWPIVEASMTPTPMEWRMLSQWPVDHIKAVYDQAGLGKRLQQVLEGGKRDGAEEASDGTDLALQAEMERLALLKLKSK